MDWVHRGFLKKMKLCRVGPCSYKAIEKRTGSPFWLADFTLWEPDSPKVC